MPEELADLALGGGGKLDGRREVVGPYSVPGICPEWVNEAIGGGTVTALGDLPAGGDDLVRVRHAVADEKRAETGLISSALTDQRSYRITVKNMHERGVLLVVQDHIPVSENQDIKVELTGRSVPTKRDVDDKRGVLSWEAKLEPDEERVIEFGYRVTWPAQRSIVYGR